MNAAAIVPAGEGRSIFALPWLGQTLIGTTDNDYEGSLEHPRVGEDDVEYLLDAVNAFFESDVRLGRARRSVRRSAAADLHRRPEEERRHLAQGRAVRDLVRDDHDHRRQVHDLAADGEDGGRPDRRARVPRCSLRDARDPARAPGRSGPARDGPGPERRVTRAPGYALRPVRRADAQALRRAARAGAARSSTACPTSSPRRWWRRASSRRAASPTCCCGARGWGCSPAGAWSRTRRAEAVAEAMAPELGWDEARVDEAVGGWLATAEQEGLVTRGRRRSIAGTTCPSCQQHGQRRKSRPPYA